MKTPVFLAPIVQAIGDISETEAQLTSSARNGQCDRVETREMSER